MGNKEYRDALVEANIDNSIAYQIRANRDSRGWTQTELGYRAGIKQAVISEWEDPNYGRYTLRTLKRLASAFDIAVIVRFVPFSDLADWNSRVPETDMSSQSFDADTGLHQADNLAHGNDIRVDSIVASQVMRLEPVITAAGQDITLPGRVLQFPRIGANRRDYTADDTFSLTSKAQ